MVYAKKVKHFSGKDHETLTMSDPYLSSEQKQVLLSGTDDIEDSSPEGDDVSREQQELGLLAGRDDKENSSPEGPNVSREHQEQGQLFGTDDIENSSPEGPDVNNEQQERQHYGSDVMGFQWFRGIGDKFDTINSNHNGSIAGHR